MRDIKNTAKWILGAIIAAVVGVGSLYTMNTLGATSVFQYFQGGTGTGTPAALGNILSWNGTNYQAIATSTLGFRPSVTYPVIITNGTVGLAFSTTTANTWSGLQTFTNAATTSFTGGIDFTRFNLSATSTGSKGINLSGGCFAINGTCVGGSGAGGGTTVVPTVAYTLHCYSTGGNPSDATSYLFCADYASGLVASDGIKLHQGIPISGIISKIANYQAVQGTIGTGELGTLKIGINGTATTTITDKLVWTSLFNTNASTTYIAVTAGDQFVIQIDTPTWSTNPTNVLETADIYIQSTTTVSTP